MKKPALSPAAFLLPFLACFLLGFSLPGQAAQEDARMRAALALLDAMDMRVTLSQTVDQVTQAEVDKNPELLPFKAVMLRFMHKYMGYDNIKGDLALLYANAFTQAELEELARFHRSPLGKKVSRRMPELTVAGSQLGQAKVETHLPELQAMVAEEARRLQATPAK